MSQQAQPIHEQVGFDYIAALRDLLTILTFKEIAGHVGYRSVGSVTAVLEGKIPSHIHGEAIWALYMEKFKRKPPLFNGAHTNAFQNSAKIDDDVSV